MLSWTQIGWFTLASLVLIFTPGPDILYVLTRGMAQGRKAALAAAAGFALGNFFHTFLVVVGLSAVLATSAAAFRLVKWAGALYLIYLGLRMIRTSSSVIPSAEVPDRTGWAVFRQSIIANILNPKVALFFLAFFPQFIRKEAGHPQGQMILLGTLFVGLVMISFGSVGFFAAALGRWLKRNEKGEKRMLQAAGVVLILLGLNLARP